MKRKEVAFTGSLSAVMAIVLLLVSLPLGRAVSSTSTFTPTSVTTTTVSSCGAPTEYINETIGAPDCIELAVSTEPQINFGQTLNVSVDVYNTLPEANDVTDVNTTAHWQFGGFPVFMWSPCWFSWPVQFMLVQGDYTLSELQALDPPTAWPGTCVEGGSVYGVTFQPASDMATVTGGDCSYTCFKILPPSTIQLHTNIRLTGSYNTSELSGNRAVYAFPNLNNSTVPAGQIPWNFGPYTLAFETEWGQVKIVHFMVT